MKKNTISAHPFFRQPVARAFSLERRAQTVSVFFVSFVNLCSKVSQFVALILVRLRRLAPAYGRQLKPSSVRRFLVVSSERSLMKAWTAGRANRDFGTAKS